MVLSGLVLGAALSNRTWGGHRYRRHRSYKSREAAYNAARNLRYDGYYARVERTDKGYTVYRWRRGWL